MKQSSIRALNELNTTFYKTVQESFDNSRSVSWAGWEKARPHITSLLHNGNQISCLDIGCGNGRFGEWLHHNSSNQIPLQYHGIDSNTFLLSKAEKTLESLSIKARLLEHDIVTGLTKNTPIASVAPINKYNLIVCFGVMHHIPSFTLRKKLLSEIASMLHKSGIAIITTWDFTTIPSLMKRAQTDLSHIIPDAEPGDYLLDWQRGHTPSTRYCHHISNQEMDTLLSGTDLSVVLHYKADGPADMSNTYWILAAQ